MIDCRSLKIALVRPYFTLSKGGAERYAVELARALVALGHAVHVFAHRWDLPEEPGISYHAIAMPRKPAWLRVLLFNRNARRAIRFSDYDAVMGMTPFWPQSVFWLGDGLYDVWTRIAWPSPALRRIMSVKRAVMTVNLWLEKRMLCGATEHFIANSQLVKRQAMRRYGVPESRISVIHPGIDTQRFNLSARERGREAMRRKLELDGDQVALLFVSNNFKRKGLDVLIRALADRESRQRDLRLIVVGGGRAAPFRRLAERGGVADRVLFAGPADAIENYYAAADVLVLPTRYDPFAAVCLEAMACGLPVITTEMNGAAEVISQGENGLVVASSRGIEKRLSSCLRSIRSVEQCAQMGRHAAAVAGHYSLGEHAQRIAGALAQCAAGRVERRFAVARPAAGLAVNESFLPLLKEHGLASFSALMDCAVATRLSYNRGKRIDFLTLGDGKQRRGFFLKRHAARRPWFERLFFSSQPRRQISEGMREWENIVAFRARGLPSVVPVAAGERVLPRGQVESFVLTLRLDGFLPLDEYALTRLAAYTPAEAAKKRRQLVAALASLTREMHWAGFNHRDFYLCHIFVKDAEGAPPELRVIDLQRLGMRKRPAYRWRIKDLAQLHFSSLAILATERDRLRFFALYAPARDDRRERRRILRSVLKKSRSIAGHDAQLRLRQGDQKVLDPFKASAQLLESSTSHDRTSP